MKRVTISTGTHEDICTIKAIMREYPDMYGGVWSTADIIMHAVDNFLLTCRDDVMLVERQKEDREDEQE